MPYPSYQQQYYRPYVPHQNGMGVAGFTLGFIGLLFSFVPLVGVVAWPLVILGMIASGLGLSKTHRGQANKLGYAVAGLLTSATGLIVCMTWMTALP
jgi:ABC-type transport system involved in cytochrome bd biosynthesis fused ATPase/permease subunit